MLVEFTAYLISSTINLFSIFTGTGSLTIAVVFLSLITVYNLFLYNVYKGIKSTLVPPIFVTITLLHTVLKFFRLPGYLVDLALLATVLVLLGLYWDYYSVRDALSNVTPVILLASALVGVWAGLDTPARYSLASIIDVIAYRLLREFYPIGAILKYLIFLEFLTIYFNPALYVNVYVLACNSLLFFVKVLFHERYKRKTLFMINLDILFKPLVVRWLA